MEKNKLQAILKKLKKIRENRVRLINKNKFKFR